jgi:hypothetical protein
MLAVKASLQGGLEGWLLRNQKLKLNNKKIILPRLLALSFGEGWERWLFISILILTT